jgi:hypothetical protein
LPAQIFPCRPSNLLWAPWGINRPKQGLRTAPSAVDWQEIDVSVVMKAGTYVLDAATNTLKPDLSGDYRALTGIQPFVKGAPVTLVTWRTRGECYTPLDGEARAEMFGNVVPFRKTAASNRLRA